MKLRIWAGQRLCGGLAHLTLIALGATTLTLARHRWRIMATIFLGNFMAGLDGTIVNVSLPLMVEELESDVPTIAWVIIAYRLALATTLLTFGRLSDLLGSRPIFSWGLLLFTLASALAGLSSRRAEELILYRALQGLGGSMMLSNTFAIVTNAFPGERGKAIGLIALSWTLGSTLGPGLGGALIAQLGWRSIFLINLPVGLLGFALARISLEPSPPRRGSLDCWGALMLALTLAPLLLALRELSGALAWGRALPLLSLSLGALLLFIVVEKGCRDPLIDLALVRKLHYALPLIARMAMVASLAVVDLMMPFYLTGIFGLEPLSLGVLLMVLPLAFGFVGSLSGWASDRLGVEPLAIAGALLMAVINLLLLYHLPSGGEGLPFVLLALMGYGVAAGLFFSPNASGLMGATPEDRRGFTSSLLPTTWNVAYSLGSAMAGLAFSLALQPGMPGAEGASPGPLSLLRGLRPPLLLSGLMALLASLLYSLAYAHNGGRRGLRD